MDNWNTELALTFHEETKHSYEECVSQPVLLRLDKPASTV